MTFPPDVAERLLVACHRRCCICHKFTGTKMEIHHIVPRSEGGPDTQGNGIPLCFDCHADVHTCIFERAFATYGRADLGSRDPDFGRPLAAPLDRCAELLGVDLATIRELATNVEPYLRADGIPVWSLTQLERQLRPEAFHQRRGGYIDRRRTPTSGPGC